MMTKILFSVFTVCFCFKVIACEVKLPENLILFDDKPSLENNFFSENCQKNVVSEVIQTLASADGRISGYQLSEILKNKLIHITVQNEFIQIQHLNNLIREKFTLPTNTVLTNLKSNLNQNYLALNSMDKVELYCKSCHFNSKENLEIKINRMDGTTQSISVDAHFKKMVNAFRVIGNQPAFTDLISVTLHEELVESIPHTDLFNQMEHLRFYKLNKPIHNGTILRQSDLTAIDLVKAGLKTEVLIENELIRLKTYGISRGHGSIGALVEVFHPQKNKKYLGKVIDFNKVLVEL